MGLSYAKTRSPASGDSAAPVHIPPGRDRYPPPDDHNPPPDSYSPPFDDECDPDECENNPQRDERDDSPSDGFNSSSEENKPPSNEYNQFAGGFIYLKTDQKLLQVNDTPVGSHRVPRPSYFPRLQQGDLDRNPRTNQPGTDLDPNSILDYDRHLSEQYGELCLGRPVDWDNVTEMSDDTMMSGGTNRTGASSHQGSPRIPHHGRASGDAMIIPKKYGAGILKLDGGMLESRGYISQKNDGSQGTEDHNRDSLQSILSKKRASSSGMSVNNGGGFSQKRGGQNHGGLQTFEGRNRDDPQTRSSRLNVLVDELKTLLEQRGFDRDSHVSDRGQDVLAAAELFLRKFTSESGESEVAPPSDQTLDGMQANVDEQNQEMRDLEQSFEQVRGQAKSSLGSLRENLNEAFEQEVETDSRLAGDNILREGNENKSLLRNKNQKQDGSFPSRSWLGRRRGSPTKPPKQENVRILSKYNNNRIADFASLSVDKEIEAAPRGIVCLNRVAPASMHSTKQRESPTSPAIKQRKKGRGYQENSDFTDDPTIPSANDPQISVILDEAFKDLDNLLEEDWSAAVQLGRDSPESDFRVENFCDDAKEFSQGGLQGDGTNNPQKKPAVKKTLWSAFIPSWKLWKPTFKGKTILSDVDEGEAVEQLDKTAELMKEDVISFRKKLLGLTDDRINADIPAVEAKRRRCVNIDVTSRMDTPSPDVSAEEEEENTEVRAWLNRRRPVSTGDDSGDDVREFEESLDDVTDAGLSDKNVADCRTAFDDRMDRNSYQDEQDQPNDDVANERSSGGYATDGEAASNRGVIYTIASPKRSASCDAIPAVALNSMSNVVKGPELDGSLRKKNEVAADGCIFTDNVNIFVPGKEMQWCALSSDTVGVFENSTKCKTDKTKAEKMDSRAGKKDIKKLGGVGSSNSGSSSGTDSDAAKGRMINSRALKEGTKKFRVPSVTDSKIWKAKVTKDTKNVTLLKTDSKRVSGDAAISNRKASYQRVDRQSRIGSCSSLSDAGLEASLTRARSRSKCSVSDVTSGVDSIEGKSSISDTELVNNSKSSDTDAIDKGTSHLTETEQDESSTTKLKAKEHQTTSVKRDGKKNSDERETKKGKTANSETRKERKPSGHSDVAIDRTKCASTENEIAGEEKTRVSDNEVQKKPSVSDTKVNMRSGLPMKKIRSKSSVRDSACPESKSNVVDPSTDGKPSLADGLSSQKKASSMSGSQYEIGRMYEKKTDNTSATTSTAEIQGNAIPSNAKHKPPDPRLKGVKIRGTCLAGPNDRSRTIITAAWTSSSETDDVTAADSLFASGKSTAVKRRVKGRTDKPKTGSKAVIPKKKANEAQTTTNSITISEGEMTEQVTADEGKPLTEMNEQNDTLDLSDVNKNKPEDGEIICEGETAGLIAHVKESTSDVDDAFTEVNTTEPATDENECEILVAGTKADFVTSGSGQAVPEVHTAQCERSGEISMTEHVNKNINSKSDISKPYKFRSENNSSKTRAGVGRSEIQVAKSRSSSVDTQGSSQQLKSSLNSQLRSKKAAKTSQSIRLHTSSSDSSHQLKSSTNLSTSLSSNSMQNKQKSTLLCKKTKSRAEGAETRTVTNSSNPSADLKCVIDETPAVDNSCAGTLVSKTCQVTNLTKIPSEEDGHATVIFKPEELMNPANAESLDHLSDAEVGSLSSDEPTWMKDDRNGISESAGVSGSLVVRQGESSSDVTSQEHTLPLSSSSDLTVCSSSFSAKLNVNNPWVNLPSAVSHRKYAEDRLMVDLSDSSTGLEIAERQPKFEKSALNGVLVKSAKSMQSFTLKNMCSSILNFCSIGAVKSDPFVTGTAELESIPCIREKKHGEGRFQAAKEKSEHEVCDIDDEIDWDEDVAEIKKQQADGAKTCNFPCGTTFYRSDHSVDTLGDTIGIIAGTIDRDLGDVNSFLDEKPPANNRMVGQDAFSANWADGSCDKISWRALNDFGMEQEMIKEIVSPGGVGDISNLTSSPHKKLYNTDNGSKQDHQPPSKSNLQNTERENFPRYRPIIFNPRAELLTPPPPLSNDKKNLPDNSLLNRKQSLSKASSGTTSSEAGAKSVPSKLSNALSKSNSAKANDFCHSKFNSNPIVYRAMTSSLTDANSAVSKFSAGAKGSVKSSVNSVGSCRNAIVVSGRVLKSLNVRRPHCTKKLDTILTRVATSSHIIDSPHTSPRSINFASPRISCPAGLNNRVVKSLELKKGGVSTTRRTVSGPPKTFANGGAKLDADACDAILIPVQQSALLSAVAVDRAENDSGGDHVGSINHSSFQITREDNVAPSSQNDQGEEDMFPLPSFLGDTGVSSSYNAAAVKNLSALPSVAVDDISFSSACASGEVSVFHCQRKLGDRYLYPSHLDENAFSNFPVNNENINSPVHNTDSVPSLKSSSGPPNGSKGPRSKLSQRHMNNNASAKIPREDSCQKSLLSSTGTSSPSVAITPNGRSRLVKSEQSVRGGVNSSPKPLGSSSSRRSNFSYPVSTTIASRTRCSSSDHYSEQSMSLRSLPSILPQKILPKSKNQTESLTVQQQSSSSEVTQKGSKLHGRDPGAMRSQGISGEGRMNNDDIVNALVINNDEVRPTTATSDDVSLPGSECLDGPQRSMRGFGSPRDSCYSMGAVKRCGSSRSPPSTRTFHSNGHECQGRSTPLWPEPRSTHTEREQSESLSDLDGDQSELNARFERDRSEMNAQFYRDRSEMDAGLERDRSEMNAHCQRDRSEMNAHFERHQNEDDDPWESCDFTFDEELYELYDNEEEFKDEPNSMWKQEQGETYTNMGPTSGQGAWDEGGGVDRRVD